MRVSLSVAFVLAVVGVCNVQICTAEIETSFAGFPAINVLQPGDPTFDTPLTSDFVDAPLRPKWTRAMADVGGWPTMFEFKNDIYLEFNLVDGHRGAGGAPGATGQLVRYRSSDDGNTWQMLGGSVGAGSIGEYVVKGDTLYRYDWDPVGAYSAVSTSTDGVNFTTMQQAYDSPYYMYGAIYDQASNKFYAPPHMLPQTSDETQRQVHLIESDNGINWDYVSTLHGPGGHESETVIHIKDDGTMIAFVREKYAARRYFLATSQAPYTEWNSVQGDFSLEGQHFFEVDGQLFLGSRAFLDPDLATDQLILDNAILGQNRLPYTMIYRVEDDNSLTPWAVLDSLGDNSYPRVVVTGDEVLIAYYSQHQDGVDKVYLAAFDKDVFLAGHLPEPSTFVLAAMGLGALCLLWRRRRATLIVRNHATSS